MNSRMTETLLLSVVLLLIGSIITCDLLLRRDCVKSGRHYVRGMTDYECVK